MDSLIETAELLLRGATDDETLSDAAMALGGPDWGDPLLELHTLVADEAVRTEQLPWRVRVAVRPWLKEVLEELKAELPGVVEVDGARCGLTPLGYRLVARLVG